jgi:hypothetical protein
VDLFFRIYIGFWSLTCLLALITFLRFPSSFWLGRVDYWRFICEPWKLIAFGCATAIISLGAPYMGDPTWDRVDGLFMSIFCFTTAPWVVAVLFYAPLHKVTLVELYLAVCAWFFSASWSYDIYLVWRDGAYPSTWYANLFASSVIYLCAGLFWNLEWVKGRGVIFSFMRDGWPSRAAKFAPWRLAVYALVFAMPLVVAFWLFMI